MIARRYVEDERPIEVKLEEAHQQDPEAIQVECPTCHKQRVRSKVSGVGEFSLGQYKCKSCQRDYRLNKIAKPKAIEEEVVIDEEVIIDTSERVQFVPDIPARFITIQRGTLNTGGSGRFAVQPSSAAFIYFEDNEDGIPTRAEIVFPISAYNVKSEHYQHMAIIAEGEDAVRLSVYADAFSGVPQAEETMQIIQSLEHRIAELRAQTKNYLAAVRQHSAQEKEAREELHAIQAQLRALGGGK